MTIYYGSSKIKEVYKGGTPIKEVYNGGDLVYKKNTGLKCFYGVDVNNYWASMVYDKYELGSIASVYRYMSFVKPTQYPTTIQAINGSLGKSGSTIKIFIENGTVDCSYTQSLTISNKTFYVYHYESLYYPIGVYVEEGSVVGNYALPHIYDSKSTVTSISDAQFRVNYQGSVSDFIRNPSEDCFWSKERGFYKE